MRIARAVYDFVEMVIIAAVITIVTFMFVGRLTIVDGPSMMNTLIDGEVLAVSNVGYTPQNGDIVVFQSPNSHVEGAIVKRVIATEGQTVDINFETWEISVDGEVLSEDYINDQEKALGYPLNQAGSTRFPFTVSEDCVFVLGDNRNHSSDSRYYGEFTRDDIMGRVLVRILPLDAIGTVKPADSDRIAKIKAKN